MSVIGHFPAQETGDPDNQHSGGNGYARCSCALFRLRLGSFERVWSPAKNSRSAATAFPRRACAQNQLGFGSGGYTGTAGTKPFRFGISTFGRLLASMTSVSPMMPFRYNINATTA